MVITASEARAQLFPLIERVNNDSTPIVITSKKRQRSPGVGERMGINR